jgi:hypothetical protein
MVVYRKQWVARFQVPSTALVSKTPRLFPFLFFSLSLSWDLLKKEREEIEKFPKTAEKLELGTSEGLAQ